MANVASVPAGVATGWRPGAGNRPAPASRLNSWLRCKRRQAPCGAYGEKGTLGAAPLPGRPLSSRTPTRRSHPAPARRPHCCALSGTRMPRAGRAPAEGGLAPGARSSRCLRPRPLAWRRLVPNFGTWAPRKGAARVGRPVLSPRPSRAAGEPTCGAGSPGTLEEGVASGRTRRRTQSAGEVAKGPWGLGQEPLFPRGALLLNSFSTPAWPQLPPALRLRALAWPQPRGPA
ncbi:putative uncharacterized protein PAK6-AS1 [Pongo pygmaeus]|uniref:putative uncharacterized protein PAK6-AS1 n=1 Tax=Pongo pygmaeus TaxID=9600 RepID=UPI0023E2FD35|nr:putative uncharacterized protein PAK6-AS1 [Pongo pygmaeus]